MMAACGVSRNAIQQVISRLRRHGFTIQTISPPCGPYPCDHYHLQPGQEARALIWLTNTYVRPGATSIDS